MTTPANNSPNGGADKPEDDDPFGYLYEDGQAAGATPPGQGGGYGYPGLVGGQSGGAQPGVPRTSYNQVRTVGDRPYGGQRGPVPYQQGGPQQGGPQQSQGYQAQYQAPEALQAGGYGVPPQQQSAPQYTQSVPLPGGGGHGGGGGSSRKGMLIAAVAVVAAVAIGIGAAVTFGDKDKNDDKNKANPGQSQSAPSNNPSGQPSGSASPEAELPKGDAGGPGMVISGGASLMNTTPGAKSASGQYVGNFNQPGAAVTWTLDVPKEGTYRLYVRFGIPGEDANGTLAVNGKPNGSPLSMRNFAGSAKGDWEKGWQSTWGQVTLNKGTNTIKLSCEAGNKCQVNIDQLWLQAGG
ncbi:MULTISPECIES: CBM35 domain-containing protein [unclassified Streptomyces]|uniref:CBM35 domain-containing protein n=1 Tax=unclassified Streptomyces TaxID=2593676 RepID=UPI000DC7ADEA|nr:MULTISPECIES: CBM35 domain-containing protein [unclassified Streptomyces]AWZ04992.1 carbohydrate-binding protein [Streptomyces sp. ICC4]AWZ14436.1 carbohydrate-binding protein [Streptomyces sp. ICC1]